MKMLDVILTLILTVADRQTKFTMASIWRHPKSPFWMACFTANAGARTRQLKLTTGTGDRSLARRIADELEAAARGLRSNEKIKSFLDEFTDLKVKDAARRSFDSALRHTTGSGLGSKSVRGFTKSWLERTQGEVSYATNAKYEYTAKLLLASLGAKADHDMDTIRRDDIARFRDDQAKRVARSTTNGLLKIVRIIFAAAEADGAVQRNEARYVKGLKTQNVESPRRAFTLPELKSVLAECDDEWRSIVLFGFYTGLRLSDVAELTWQNLYLNQSELRIVTGKRGRQVVIPLALPLLQHIETLPAGDDPKQPVHERSFGILTRHKYSGALSNQFHKILANAGLVKARSHKAPKGKEGKGTGRASRRTVSEISFHCLRHTNVSLLKNAGVSDAIAQDLVGHDSVEVSRLYTHIDDKAKRDAVNMLPVIGAEAKQ